MSTCTVCNSRKFSTSRLINNARSEPLAGFFPRATRPDGAAGPGRPARPNVLRENARPAHFARVHRSTRAFSRHDVSGEDAGNVRGKRLRATDEVASVDDVDVLGAEARRTRSRFTRRLASRRGSRPRDRPRFEQFPSPMKVDISNFSRFQDGPIKFSC